MNELPAVLIYTAAVGLGCAACLAAEPDKQAAWRTLPLITEGKVDSRWQQVGWGGFAVDGDALRTECDPRGLGLLVYTNERFGNCQIRVVFKTRDARSNAGVYVRIDDGILDQVGRPGAAFKRDAAGKIEPASMQAMMASAEREEGPWFAVHRGYEVQIMDQNDPLHRTGAIYSLAAASEAPKPRDQWRTLVISLSGTRILVEIDGRRVTSFVSASEKVDGTRKWFEPKREPKRPEIGYIGLQNHDPGDVVWFKEVSVCTLSEQPGGSDLGTEAPGKVELLRDRWGVPHIFSDTDAGAMYGLGYVTAQERGFQMTYGLRIMQGRLAEVLGDRQRGGRRETALDNDRRMRTFGWARAAKRVAPSLDVETRGLLQAYCEGVNRSFAEQRETGTLHPLFAELEVTPEEWTPADCLLSWWHVAQFFSGDGTRDLLVWRNRLHPQPGQPQPPGPGPLWADDEAAVVRRQDVADEWLERVNQFEAARGRGGPQGAAPSEGPKFSHAWVVGGGKSTTGAAVLVSDPQTPVRNPSLWMEFHVKGKTFDARGIGMPGSPGLLVGFNRKVAWGLTALGADQADLFRLETAPDRPDEYLWNGAWRKMEVRTEAVGVKGRAAVSLTIRETHLGPVVSEFAFRQPRDPEVALKRVPVCETDRDTIQGALGIMRAQSSAEFREALAAWRFPSANCLYGDSDGHIGFSVIGAIPVRSRSAGEANGGEALPGTGDRDDWQGFVPAALVPQVRDPGQGFLLSANHRSIGSFYPVSLGTSTGSMGDTIRSWRLRERLAAIERFSPTNVLEVHYDTVNPARREIVRLGLHLRRVQPGALSEASLKALDPLDKWLTDGASSDLNSEHAELAMRLSTFFRFVVTPLATRYGGGESGLARFLKDASARVGKDPAAKFDEAEAAFIDRVLSEAWNGSGASGRGEAGPGRAERPSALGWFDSLDGFGSLDPGRDLRPAAITCLDGQTIHCQSAQSYTQWVPLHDVDSSRSICPIGHSDRPDGRYRTSTMELWGSAQLHPAPLSRQAVERITAERQILEPDRQRGR